MSQPAASLPDPWQLVWGQPYIDSGTLAAALEGDLQRHPRPDYRTRLLVRDAAQALRSHWGAKKFTRWLTASQMGERIRTILAEPFAEIGFPHLRRRLVDSIGSTQIKQIFTLLGEKVHARIEVNVAGSIPTLLAGLTALLTPARSIGACLFYPLLQ